MRVQMAPDNVVRRRFQAGWRNFQEIYKKLVDDWVLYDNYGETPSLVEHEISR